MTLIVNDVVARARGFSVANNAANLTSDSAEMIGRVNAYQQEIFSKVADAERFFYAEETKASTVGPPRSLDLSTLTGPVERIVRILRADGVPIRQVDFEDQRSELPPRCYRFGTVLFEVTTDWAGTGAVNLTIGYALGAALLDPTAGLGQTLSLPDKYLDVPATMLAAYLVRKDTGRDPVELQSVEALASSRMDALLTSLTHYEGFVTRRFVSPGPAGQGEG